MEWLFLLLLLSLICWVIILAVFHWQIALVIAVVGIIIYRVRKQKKEDRQRREELARQQQQHDAEQEKCRAVLANLCDTSLSLFEAMPRHLMTTEELLDQADVDFQERAFAPFWDSVEQAATQLGSYDESVRQITENAHEHETFSQEYEDKLECERFVRPRNKGQVAVRCKRLAFTTV